ncbi:hypothetical protein [Pseudomonas brassicacearum]|uniref:hypothetical protein n=1 Tax=Pseudomonas brassicacearum TaxID=930166 RepID=UPI0011F31869|nr:hypothetical protein [Pseudomonas brassicacearum]QEO79868.1 hypothetical protein ELZ14_20770 [Pseudomonas brassicacearum]
MNTLSALELESIPSSRLFQCTVVCSIIADGSLSVDVMGTGTNQFTIANIDRSHYRGETGINKLVREILEEMVMARQASYFI